MSDYETIKGEEPKTGAFELPKGCEPWESVSWCGLRALNVPFLVEAEGFPPLVIGKGRVPMVWLAQLGDKAGDQWKWVVVANAPKDGEFRVNQDEEKRLVTIRKSGLPILSARVGPFNVMTVDYLDLRPIGINIHGEKGSLWACEQKMNNCAYMNVKTVFDIGPPPKN